MLVLKLVVLVLLSNSVFGWGIIDKIPNERYFTSISSKDGMELKPLLFADKLRKKLLDIINIKPPMNEENVTANDETTTDQSIVETTTEQSNDATTTDQSIDETTTEQSNDETTTNQSNDETTTTEIPTTTDEPSTTSEGPEPRTCNSSLYSIKDLEFIIDHVANQNAIFTNIISDINKNVTQIRDIFLGDIKRYYTLLENGSEHLEHTLKGFNDTRKKLEPRLEKIAVSLKNYNDLLISFQEQNNTANDLFKKFRKINSICEFGCGKSIQPERVNVLRKIQTYNPQEYYCGSIEEIKDVILAALNNYSESLQNEMRDKINNDTETLKKDIEAMKNDLKETVLQTFDHTFYDILKLQDDYSHFSENIDKVDVSKIDDIKQNTAELLPKLMAFKDTVSKFNKFCRACDNDLVIHYLNSKLISEETETYNLLNDIIKAKQAKVTSIIKNDYYNVLKPLKDQLIKPYEIDIKYIEEINDDVRAKVETERALFVNLKSQIDPLTYLDIENLQKESLELLQNIDKHTDLINNFMEKN